MYREVHSGLVQDMRLLFLDENVVCKWKAETQSVCTLRTCDRLLALEICLCVTNVQSCNFNLLLKTVGMRWSFMYFPIFNRDVNPYIKSPVVLLGAFSLAVRIVFYQSGA